MSAAKSIPISTWRPPGGEAREYYSRIQQCVKPSTGAADQSTFFTWVGSDRSGYQLKSFELKVSNVTVAGETGNGPCTNLAFGTSTSDNNPACVDTAATVATCTASDAFTDPDCSQYFDDNGRIFYRRPSHVIPVDDACHPYRNTVDGSDSDDSNDNRVFHILARASATCSATAAQCRAFTGSTGGNVQTIFADNFEGNNVVTNNWGGSSSASAESVNPGGRSMSVTGTANTLDAVLTGKVANNSSFVLNFWAEPNGSDTIDQIFIQIGNGTTAQTFSLLKTPLDLSEGWHPYTAGPVTVSADPGTESVQLRIVANAFMDNIQLQQITDSLYLIDGSYRSCGDSDLGCTAYRDGNNNAVFAKNFTRLCAPAQVGCSALIDTQNSSTPFATLPIRGISVPSDETKSIVVNPAAFCPAASKGCMAYGTPVLDANRRVTSYETLYIKDQPDRHGQILCQAGEFMCEEFTSADGSKTYFKSPGAQTCEFKRVGGDTAFHWYVTGSNIRCPSVTPPSQGVPTGKACTLSCLGGLRNGLSCVTTSDCPADSGTCDLNTNSCIGGSNNGNFCDDQTDCASANGICRGTTGQVGKACTTNGDCDAAAGNICELWTGICPQEQSGCNEYRDPSDPAQCRASCPLETDGGQPVMVDESCQPTFCAGGTRPGAPCRNNTDCSGNGTCSSLCPAGTCAAEGIPGCRSYTYLRQTVETNANECNGRVDIANGCRPFNDTSNPTLNFRAF